MREHIRETVKKHIKKITETKNKKKKTSEEHITKPLQKHHRHT